MQKYVFLPKTPSNILQNNKIPTSTYLKNAKALYFSPVSRKLLLFYGNGQDLRLNFMMTLAIERPGLSGHNNKDVNDSLFEHNKVLYP